MSLFRVIYCSEFSGLDKHDVDRILETSNRNNSGVSVTGMLLFNAGNFLQLLEGSRANVTETFCRISSDPRHKNIELIYANSVPCRMFGDWSMNYVSIVGKAGKILKKYQADAIFKPNALSETAVECLCGEFADLYEGQVVGIGAAEQLAPDEFYQQ